VAAELGLPTMAVDSTCAWWPAVTSLARGGQKRGSLETRRGARKGHDDGRWWELALLVAIEVLDVCALAQSEEQRKW
jgi:hypothetical protein